MANPYSRPVRYKYQPINVGVLAQPLAQQQAAYDQQTALIDNASFDIKALDTDSEVVKKKKEALQASLDEMSKDLLNTKDFRSASRKLAKLNKFYTTSDEIQSHQQNYAQYQQHKADLQKRVNKGKISQGDADIALQVSLGEFDKKGGTKYDTSTGNYNQIGLANVSDNMDKEISKYADKMAKANKADSIAHLKHLSQEGLLDAENKDRLIKKVLEDNSKSDIRDATYNALINSDRFKEYLDNKADLEVRASRLNPNFKTTIYNDTVDKYDSQIATLQKVITDGQTKGNIKSADVEAYQNQINQLNSAKTNLENSYNQNATGTEDMLLRNNAVNSRLMNEASAMGDIYAYTDLDYQVYGATGKGKGKSDNALSMSGISVINKGLKKNPVKDLNTTMTNTEQQIAVNAEKLINAEESPMSFNILDNLINPEENSNLSLSPEELTKNNLAAFAKSPEVYTGQMNHILQSFDDNKDNINGFKEDLKGYGIELNDAYANSLFNEFTENPKALSSLDKSVTALGQQTTHLSNLKSYKKAIADTYLEEGKTKEFFNTIGDKKPQFFDTATSTSASPSIAHLGTVFDPAEWGLDKKGAMTYNEVAQLAGYKSAQDAVTKGYDWETTGNIKQFDPSTISKWDKPMFTSMEDFIEDERKKWNDRQGKGKASKQAKINPSNLFNYSNDERKGGVNKRENQVNVADAFERHKQFVVEQDPEKYLKESQITAYVGNSKIEKRMEEIFGGTDDLLNLMTPVFGESWEDIPGFEGSTDKDGENKNGTFTAKLKEGGNFTPSMIGDKLMFEVDYIYEVGGEKIEESVYVDFSPSMETNVLERQVTDALIEGADNSQMGDLVRDSAYKMRFDERYSSNTLNNIYADAVNIPDGGSIVLDKIPVAGSNADGIYMTTVIEKDSEGNKVIRIKSGGTGQTGYLINANTNKKLEFETAGQAKTYLSQAFLGAAKGKGPTTIPTYIE